MLNPEQIASLYPIGGIALYETSGMVSVLRYSNQPASLSPKKVTKRGKIKRLSQKSLNRLIYLTQITTVPLRSMLTLTYLCPPADGRKAKADLKKAISWIKRRKDNDCDYVWFAEFTRAGSIHFHLLLSCVPTSSDRIDFALYWLRTTSQGQGEYCSLRRRKVATVAASIVSSVSHPNTWQYLRSETGGKRYIAKYAAKPYQKEVPIWFRDIGRFWGMSASIKENQESYKIIELTEDELREILREKRRSVADWDVLPRYLWGMGDLVT
mgnify:CR=1 FL=1